LAGKILFGRPRRKWKNVKMNLKEIDWEDVDRIDLAQVREEWWDFLQAIVQLRVP
jgi:hypothetical protein